MEIFFFFFIIIGQVLVYRFALLPLVYVQIMQCVKLAMPTQQAAEGLLQLA